jgi:hypothetical protein
MDDVEAIASGDGEKVDGTQSRIAETDLMADTLEAEERNGDAEAGEGSGERYENLIETVGGVGAAGVGAGQTEAEFLDLDTEQGSHEHMACFVEEEADEEEESDDGTESETSNHDANEDAENNQPPAI